MSSPNTVNPSESSAKNVEELKVAPTATDSLTSIDPVVNLPANLKTESAVPPQPTMNGALPESEVKSIGNGITSETPATPVPTLNGQEDKPTPEGHREIPGLLPLQHASPTPNTASPPAATTLPSPRQQPPPLLPMSPTVTPVVATKSAPPPPKASAKSSSPTANSSLPKEQKTPTKRKTRSEEAEANPEKGSKNKRLGTKKRLSVASSVDSTEKGDVDSGGDGDAGRKSKRARTRTQPFQSSDTVLDANLLRVIKATAAAAAQQVSKANEEKLVVFFKGEHLAVRNAEGGFYICQAMQNISRGSHKIRIRWLSQVDESVKSKKKAGDKDPAEEGTDVYTPDFYDTTDFECILTNLELEKLGKDRYGLPLVERQRTENILRRAIQVEQGVCDNLELTEEHPDGLDVSLFHDESQLTRKQDGESSTGSDSSSAEEEEESKGRSSRVTKAKAPEPEPKASTSVVASTSSGRVGTKRTRAAALAAARKKPTYDDDEDDDESSDEDAVDEDDDADDTSSDSDDNSGKRRRGRSSPRARPSPAAKPRGKRRPAPKAKAKASPPVPKPIPMIKRTKASVKETVVTEKKSTRSSIVKILTVDVVMEKNESTEDQEPEDKKEVEAASAVPEKVTEAETKPEEAKKVEKIDTEVKKETVEVAPSIEKEEEPKVAEKEEVQVPKSDAETKVEVNEAKDVVKDVAQIEEKAVVKSDEATTNTREPEAKDSAKEA